MIELCAAIERLARNEAGAVDDFLACWAQFLEAPAHEATPRAANAAG